MALDLKKPIKTEDGRKVRILCDDLKSVKSIAAAIENYDGTEFIESYYYDGSFYSYQESYMDLINTEICNHCGSFIHE